MNLHSNFSLCFIDSSPWSSRELAMKYFENKSEYILIHDVDWFPTNKRFGTVLQGAHNFNFDDVSKNWNLYYPKKPWPAPTGPPTLVYSQKKQTHF